jgi:hypothetical protein
MMLTGARLLRLLNPKEELPLMSLREWAALVGACLVFIGLSYVTIWWLGR